MCLHCIFYRLLHLFLSDNFYSLKSLLQSQENATSFHPTKPKELIGLNVWVIHVIGEKRRRKLFGALKESPLRFDSHVFEFFYSDQGKINYHICELYKQSCLLISYHCCASPSLFNPTLTHYLNFR